MTMDMFSQTFRNLLIKLAWTITVFVISGVISSQNVSAQDPDPIEADLVILRQIIVQQKRKVLYEIDHQALAAELRSFGRKIRDRGLIEEPAGVFIKGDDPALPQAVRSHEPTWVKVFNDYVRMEFGGTFLHFALVVFREGVRGEGTKNLGEGIWFDAEDGEVPAKE